MGMSSMCRGRDSWHKLSSKRELALLILILVFNFGCFVSDVHCLDTNQCTGPLGMETGEIPDTDITASSSFDAGNVGPQNGRVRVERQGGAWCPKNSVTSEAEEWLQIDLHTPHVITATEIQGRFGNGDGREFAESYLVSYWRPNIGKWIRYRDRSGNEILPGNINTYLVTKTTLDPPIIASKVRFMARSDYRRTVCIRTEIYGCPLKGGLVSYSMEQGSVRGEGWDFYDHTYDGITEGGYLTSGLGSLTDGRVGPTNLKDDYYKHGRGKGWVGWKNESRSGTDPLEIVFHFDSIREFNAVHIHVSNQFSESVQVFAEAKIFFSVGGKVYPGDSITYTTVEDCIFEDPKNVTIKLHHRIGKYVKIHLYWSSKWILLSEFQFDSMLAMGNFTEEEVTVLPPTTVQPKPKRNESEQEQTQVHQVHQIPEDISVGASSRVTEDWSVSSVAVMITAVLSSFIAIVVVLVIIFTAMVVRHKLATLVKLPGSSQSSLQYGGATVSVVNDGHGPSLEFTTSSDDSPAKNLIRSTQLSIATAQDYQEPMTSTNFSSFKGSTSTSSSTFHHRRGSFNGHGQMAEFYSCSLVSNPTPTQNPDSCNEYEYVHPTECGKLLPHQFSPKRSLPPELCQSLGRNHAIHFRDIGVPEISRHRLNILRHLGEGTFGSVFVGELEKCGPADRRLVVVKSMLRNASEKDKRLFVEEIRILASLKDPNVTQVLGVSSEMEPYSVILEFLEHGDLCEFLRQRDGSSSTYFEKLSLGDLLLMASQIASGMRYLESLNVVHRDLATRNCIVGRGLTVKICHFASDMDVYASDYYKLEGTPFPVRWMAWESIFLGIYSTKSDIWSFGVTLWEIFNYCRYSPYKTMTNQEVISNLERLSIEGESSFFKVLEKPPHCPRDIYQLMRDTWSRESGSRPSFWDIHHFLQNICFHYQTDMINREIPAYTEAHAQQYIV